MNCKAIVTMGITLMVVYAGLVSAESSDSSNIKTKLVGMGSIEAGQFVHCEVNGGDNPTDKLWYEKAYMHLGFITEINERTKLSFVGEGMVHYAYDLSKDKVDDNRPQYSFYPHDVSFSYSWGDVNRPWLKFQSGIFPFKYNPDVRNLGKLVLDPNLISSVPDPQRFYTAMDCYIHNIEAANGHRKTVMGDSLGTESLRLCREIFLSKDSRTAENDEKLMIASYLGGLSLTYSEVGACHAISYGLASVTGVHHGLGNCIVFNQLDEFYPEGVKEFRVMMKNNNIELPKGFNANRSTEEIEQMIDVSLTLIFMWAHVCGPDWEKIITREKLRGLLMKM